MKDVLPSISQCQLVWFLGEDDAYTSSFLSKILFLKLPFQRLEKLELGGVTITRAGWYN